MRDKFNKEHVLSLCKPDDCGMMAPPMDAQVALNELCRYFLGKDWYDSSGACSPEQVNTAIVAEIEMNYRGARLKRKSNI